MKKLLALGFLALLTPVAAFAQSDFSVTWALSGIDNVDEMTVDLDIGTTFISGHGGISLSNGLTSPMTGTCFTTAQGGIFCTFVLTQGVSGSLDIGASLNGTWRTFDLNGATIESGAATFVGLN